MESVESVAGFFDQHWPQMARIAQMHRNHDTTEKHRGEPLGAGEPPPRCSARGWAPTRIALLRRTLLLGGGRSPHLRSPCPRGHAGGVWWSAFGGCRERWSGVSLTP